MSTAPDLENPLLCIPIIHRVLLFGCDQDSMQDLLRKSTMVTSTWRESITEYGAPLLRRRMQLFQHLQEAGQGFAIFETYPTQFNFTKQLVLACRRDVGWFFGQCLFAFKNSTEHDHVEKSLFTETLRKEYFTNATIHRCVYPLRTGQDPNEHQCLQMMLDEPELFDVHEWLDVAHPSLLQQKQKQNGESVAESTPTAMILSSVDDEQQVEGPKNQEQSSSGSNNNKPKMRRSELWHDLCAGGDHCLPTLKFLLKHIELMEGNPEASSIVLSNRKPAVSGTRLFGPDSGETPVFKACRNGCVGITRYLVSRPDFSPRVVNNWGESLLVVTAASEKERASSSSPSRIVDRDGNVVMAPSSSASPARGSSSPTSGNNHIISSPYVEIAQLLLDAGADVNHVPSDGKTALWHACDRGSLAMARLLISAGAEKVINVADKCNGHTALHRACAQCSSSIVRLLCDLKSCDVRIQDTRKKQQPMHVLAAVMTLPTPLEVAQFSQIVKILKERGADIDAQDVDGNTPLHVAAYQGGATPPAGEASTAYRELLEKGGAHSNVLNNVGEFAEQISKRKSSPRHNRFFDDGDDEEDAVNQMWPHAFLPSQNQQNHDAAGIPPRPPPQPPRQKGPLNGGVRVVKLG